MRTLKHRIQGFSKKVRNLFQPHLSEDLVEVYQPGLDKLMQALRDEGDYMANEIKMAKGQGEMEINENGVKRESNKGRGRFDLIPYEALEELAKWYEAGAEKYGDRNWEKGISVKDCMNRMARHSAKACNGWLDEGPFAHLAAVIWNAMAAITGIKRNPYTNDFFRDDYLNILGLMKITQEKSPSGEKDAHIDTSAFVEGWKQGLSEEKGPEASTVFKNYFGNFFGDSTFDHMPVHTKNDFPVYIHSRNGLLTDKAKFRVDVIDHQLVINCDFENEEDLKEFQANLARAGIKGRESEIISEHEQRAEPKLEIFQKPMNVGFYGKKRKSLIILNNVYQEESKIIMSDFKELFDDSFPMSMIYFPIAKNLELEFDCPKKKDFDNIIELIQSKYPPNPGEPD